MIAYKVFNTFPEKCDEELGKKLKNLSIKGVEFNAEFYKIFSDPNGKCAAPEHTGDKDKLPTQDKLPRQCCGNFPNAYVFYYYESYMYFVPVARGH